MNSVTVFCGSNPGFDPEYSTQAGALGAELARRGLTTVYGGATVGSMGQVADAALATGGKVIGVLPRQLFDKEIGHTGLTEMHVVDSMHERKLLMSNLCDAFIALPGGIGTLEELAEMLTWAQLQIHSKPVGVLNIGGFYDPLLAFLDHAIDRGFMRASNRDLFLIDASVTDLLDRMESYEPPAPSAKWFDANGSPLP